MRNRTKKVVSKPNLRRTLKLEKPPGDLLLHRWWRVVVRVQVVAVSDQEPDAGGDEGDEEGEDEVAAPALRASRLQQVVLVVLLRDAVTHALKDFLYTLRRNLLDLVQSRLKFHVRGT